MQIISRRTEKKEKLVDLNTKYAEQIAQLKADGVKIKNERVLTRLLEKANGEIDDVKQLIAEREEKHLKRREYQRKHRSKSPMATDEGENTTGCRWKRHLDYSDEDLDTLKNLRAAGVHGNPKKLLAFHRECEGSIEMIKARVAEQREERSREREERTQVSTYRLTRKE
jgi:hypothetical protein